MSNTPTIWEKACDARREVIATIFRCSWVARGRTEAEVEKQLEEHRALHHQAADGWTFSRPSGFSTAARGLAAILLLALAVPARAEDGGADVRFVHAAVTCEDRDGGTCLNPTQVGEGWWLSRERLTLVGTQLVALENENAQLKFEAAQPRPLSLGFWMGVALGFTVGVAGTAYIATQLSK